MSTESALAVEVHYFASIEQCSSWPPEISHIYRTCNSPLPSWCFTGPYPPASNRTFSLLSELSESFTCDDSRSVVQERLSDVFNVSLSTVADIRSLIKNYGSVRSALPFVLGLMRVLAHMCVPESIIITDTPFVRPRRPAPDRGFDGAATMLACHVKDSSSLMDISKESPYSSCSEQGSEVSLPTIDMMSGDTLFPSECSDTGPPSIDLPLEAHVVPGRGRQFFAVIPFLSIADSNNVVDMMSSVACQRYVWGIPEPAVGFALSETGVVAKLVVSWVDLATHVIHIACADSRQCGIFDLTNPTSTLRFSQLILDLSPYFAFTTEPLFPNNRLDWRSDTAEITSENFTSWRDRVEQWVQDVETSSGKASFSRPPTPPPSPPTIASDKDISLTKSNGHFASDPRETSSRPLEKELSESTEPEKPRSYCSSSDFIGFGFSAWSPPDTESDAEVTWMLDRTIFLATRIPFDVSKAFPGDEAIEFNDRLAAYDEICDFVWPSSWDAVDGSLSQSKILLFQQASECKLSRNSVLTLEHQQRLQERMSAILYASAGSFTRDMKQQGIKVKEEDGRYDWDALLYHFYSKNGEDVSPYVLCIELKPEFSKDPDEPFISRETDSSMSPMLNCWSKLTGNNSEETDPCVSRRSLLSQRARIALMQATDFLMKLNPMLNSPDALKKLVQDRSRQEPRVGKCDALLFAAIEGCSIGAEFIVSPDKISQPDDLKSVLHNRVHTVEKSATPAPEPGPTHPFANHLLLPHFVAKYQGVAEHQGVDKVSIQGRMHLASLVAFYSAFGIDDYPFYCLVTFGKVGTLLMAWRSSIHKQTYLVERNMRKFDLSVPIEAFQFATFLLRLRDDQEKLKQHVEQRLKEGVDQDRLRQWTKCAQMGETPNDQDAEAGLPVVPPPSPDPYQHHLIQR
ncbi:hypothetical protein B0H12DRAFT_1303529 [Mycena haematopus]|nr:hypothetical protein B0H12DRAFT_1303529 [Mycena haematopus]